MKTPNRSGAALVITLSLLILLTICILAFMAVVRWDRQSANLTAAATRADILGRSAGNLILADILAEVRDGSTNLGSNNAVSYFVLTNLNAVPQRVLADTNMAANTNFASLYKQSAPKAFYTGANFSSNGPIRASDVGTWEPSLNGRVLSPQRWNKPELLFGTGFSTTNQTPRWVYLTRRETTEAALLNPTSWSTNLANATNDSFVIGRIAYNVYEIGGTLDANVAGGVSGLAKAQLLSSLAGAALTNLPGATNALSLVSWRNPVTGPSQSQYLSYAATNGLKTGFLDKTNGDRRFVSRQDLIAYARENTNGGLTTSTLPYLTHFSRGLDRPSLPASTNDTVLAGYPARPAGINPAPLTVKYDSDVTLPDGTKLKSGDPVAFRRFPLRRIGLLKQDSVSNADNANEIYRFFGLSRGSKTDPWTYDHGANNRILTLAEVKTLGREPDFFEILQAAIKSGSLGGSGGVPPENANPKYGTLTKALDENIYHQVISIGANIIDQYDENDFPTQITIKDSVGNTIPSYGIENLPYLNEVGGLITRPATPPRKKLRGYLQFEVWNPHQNAPNTDSSLSLRVVATSGRANIRPGNWQSTSSPGATASRFNGLYNGPVAAAYGVTNTTTGSPREALPNLDAYVGNTNYPSFKMGGSTSAAGAVDFTTDANQQAHGTLEFKNSPQLQEPFLLTAPGDPAAAASPTTPPFAYDGTGGGSTSPTSIVDETTPASLPLVDWPGLPSPNGRIFDSPTRIRFAGIMVAETDFLDDRVDGRPDGMSFGEGIDLKCWGQCAFDIPASRPLTLELQVKTPDGWKTYQRVPNITALTTSNRTSFWENKGNLPADKAASVSFIRPWVEMRPDDYKSPEIPQYVGYNTIAAIDPRTSRFIYILRASNGPLSTGNYGGSTARIYGNGNDWIADTSGNSSKLLTALAANIPNHSSGQQYYKDPDGVVRRGDGEERPELGSSNWVNPIYSGYRIDAAPYTALKGKMEDRPVILNRPFESVGEIGYAFRDMPWKSLDFYSATSGDGALLDYFTIDETALDANRRPLRAGVVNPNTASTPVLESIALDAMRKETALSKLSPQDTGAIAQSIRDSVTASPLSSIADLPSLSDSVIFPSAPRQILRKTEKEAWLRALAPVTEINVWNIMIDMVAQAGRFPPSANGLKDFMVAGEARYWIFAAIDRTTGKIIDIQYELVTE